MGYADYQPKSGPPWVQGENASAWFTSFGGLKDDFVTLAEEAVMCAFPGVAPADALAQLEREMQLDRGPDETDADFRLRLLDAWNLWARGGTALGLLLALHFGGFPGCELRQQNGRYFKLTDPVVAPFEDSLETGDTAETPTSLISIDTSRIIPAGTPWWYLGANLDMCGRFSIYIPQAGGAFTTTGVATFTASNTATVTWSNPFTILDYEVMTGAVYSADPGPIFVTPELDSRTYTTMVATANDPFTGTAEFLAWQPGANPLGDLHPEDLARLRRVIKRWRPGDAFTTGVRVRIAGAILGHFALDDGTTLGADSVLLTPEES